MEVHRTWNLQGTNYKVVVSVLVSVLLPVTCRRVTVGERTQTLEEDGGNGNLKRVEDRRERKQRL